MNARRILRAGLVAAAVAFALLPAVVAGAAETPDLSRVQLSPSDLPDGFRVVPDADLVEAGGSAKQLGEALQSALEAASLERYQVYASDSGDELIEFVLVGPLVPPERIGITRELADAQAAADDLMPSFSAFVDQSEPRIVETVGIGDASVGFVVDSEVNSDLATVTNILGVAWTRATTQFLLSIRGDHMVVMVTQHVGAGEPQVDFLANARTVDARLAEALGLATPGVFRPSGTFSPAVANNIPTINDVSTEPSVAFANLLLSGLAVIVLTVAMRLLNTTLVRHEDALEGVLLPARALGRLWARADQAVGRAAGRRASMVRVFGVLLFYGVLFSFLEDGWRPWTVGGLFLLVVMTVAFGLVGTTDDLVELRAAHRWGLPAQLAVKPALVLFAVGSVTLTKIAQLVPGLMIGTPEAFSLEEKADERDEMRLARVGLLTTGAVALGAWALASPLDAWLDGSTGFAQSVLAGLVTLLVLVFAVAVENLFANLMAFPGSEGATLRRHHRTVWWMAMVAVTALFFHTLINPRGDLAQSLESTNVRVVLATVAAFLVFTVVVFSWFRSRDRRALTATAGSPPEAPVDMPVEMPVDMPAPAAVEMPVDMPAPAPVEMPAEMPAEMPVAVMAGAPAQAPAPSPASAHALRPALFATPVVVPQRAAPSLQPQIVPAVLPPARHHRDRSSMPGSSPVRTVKIVMTLVVLLSLAMLIAVVVVQNGRDADRLDTAHAAYVQADCTTAIARYDALLESSRLFDTAGVVAQATRERDECVELVAIDRLAVTDPAAALGRYAAFIEQHADAELSAAVDERVAAMIAGDNGIEVASPANCDAIDTFTSADGSSAALTPEDEAQMRQWCVAAYEAAGRFGDAYRFAVEVLSSSPANAQVRAEAEAAALRNPEACADSDRLAQLVGLGADGDRFASFLLNCMAAAQAPEATDTLAQLQVTFLTEFPDRAEAPAVEAALTANYSGCALLDDLRTTPATSNRPGFIATMTLSCAQVAEFVQDYDSAVEWYQWFIDNAPLDERVVTANDGLARSLIKRAQLAGAGELPAPNDTGSSGTSAVRIVIYNDSPEDLNIVMSGPESRFEFVSASPTSSTYPLVGPPSCRTDVPVIEFDVPAGQYQVLVEAASGSVDGFVGTWTLGRGDEYTSCFFIVTTFG